MENPAEYIRQKEKALEKDLMSVIYSSGIMDLVNGFEKDTWLSVSSIEFDFIVTQEFGKPPLAIPNVVCVNRAVA